LFAVGAKECYIFGDQQIVTSAFCGSQHQIGLSSDGGVIYLHLFGLYDSEISWNSFSIFNLN